MMLFFIIIYLNNEKEQYRGEAASPKVTAQSFPQPA